MIRILIVLILLGLMVACNKAPAVDMQYVNIYSLVRLANTEYGTTTDSAATLRSSIFKHYNVSEQKYVSYIAGLKKNPELWNAFQDSVISKLKYRQLELEKPKPVIDTTTSDSAKIDSTKRDSLIRKKLKQPQTPEKPQSLPKKGKNDKI